MNECSTGNGGCDGVCVNDIPGFHCECPIGSALSAVDESTCIQSANCSVEDGNFSCDCLPGYLDLTGDGLNCIGT